jgi:hypothetical protein
MEDYCKRLKEFCDAIEYIAIRVAGTIGVLFLVWEIVHRHWVSAGR